MATTYGNRPVARPYGRTDVDVTTQRANVPFLRRISWGAVLAGVAVAIVTQMALNALGLAIGAASIEPQYNATPTMPEFTSGVVIWMAASALLSLFAGGFVAGRMAGTISHTEATIHGLTTWAVVMLISAYMVSSGIGTVLGGVSNIIGSGLNLAGDAAGALAPQVGQALQRQNIELQGISEEVRQLFGNQDATATGGTDVTDGADASGTIDMNNLDDFLNNASAAERRVMFTLTQFFANPTEENRQEVVSAMTATGISEEEARNTLQGWETRMEQFRTRTEQTIEQAAGDFADGVARVAGVLFAAMVVGAAAAGGGAMVGAPDAKYIAHKMDEVAEDVAEARTE